jgi:hypothetical protein
MMLGMLAKTNKIWSWHDVKDTIRLLEWLQQAPHGKQQKIQEGSMHVKYIEKESLTSMTRCLGALRGGDKGCPQQKRRGKKKQHSPWKDSYEQ